MKVILNLNGKNKEFEIGKITGRIMLEHARISDLMSDESKLLGNQQQFYLDRCKFIVECFANQFTVDDLLDGCEATDIDLITVGIINYITERTQSKIGKIVKN